MSFSCHVLYFINPSWKRIEKEGGGERGEKIQKKNHSNLYGLQGNTIAFELFYLFPNPEFWDLVSGHGEFMDFLFIIIGIQPHFFYSTGFNKLFADVIRKDGIL